jgi:predicted nuclease with TOPRIM domain
MSSTEVIADAPIAMQTEKQCAHLQADIDQAVSSAAQSRAIAAHWKKRCGEAVAASRTLAQELDDEKATADDGHAEIERLEAERVRLIDELQSTKEHVTQEENRVRYLACKTRITPCKPKELYSLQSWQTRRRIRARSTCT